MDRKELKQYMALVKEIESLKRGIEKLREKQDDIPEVMGKVRGSSSNFPYVEQHITVRMANPSENDQLKKRIRIKEARLMEARALAIKIENFISEIPDSTDRQIFEMVFLEGKKQSEVAKVIGYTQARISQRISEVLKD